MLIIRSVEPATFVPVFWDVPQCCGMKPMRWHAYCRVRGLLALAAERDADLVGFAVAESYPEAVHILSLVGDNHACRLLLRRLVMAAGEGGQRLYVLGSRNLVVARLSRTRVSRGWSDAQFMSLVLRDV